MKKQLIYLDTSIISAFNDDRELEKSQQTRAFLTAIKKEHVYVSSLVIEEVSHIKNSVRKTQLMDLIKKYLKFEVSNEARDMAEFYIENKLIPETHPEDALHLAIATVKNIDVLVSWNYTHLVKLKTRHLVNALNLLKGYKEIDIISPIEY